jgi:hypothetical protein
MMAGKTGSVAAVNTMQITAMEKAFQYGFMNPRSLK